MCIYSKMYKNNFFKKTFFKINYIFVSSKTFLRLCMNKKRKTIFNLNKSKNTKKFLKEELKRMKIKLN